MSTFFSLWRLRKIKDFSKPQIKDLEVEKNLRFSWPEHQVFGGPKYEIFGGF